MAGPVALKSGTFDRSCALIHMLARRPAWIRPGSEGLARISGDGVADDITARQEAETMLGEQKRIVEMVAMGVRLHDTLAAIVALMEARRPGTSCGILIMSEDGTRFETTVGPRLPPIFHRTFCGASIEPPFSGACAHAGFGGKLIFVPDIAADRFYSLGWRELMRKSGLNAASSCPVMGIDGRPIAVFCAYSGDPATPPTSDPEFYEMATHLASIALERSRAEMSLRAANERLSADNAMVERLNRELAGESDRLRALFEKAPDFMCILRGSTHIFELANECFMELIGYDDPIGKAARDVLPDVEGQGLFDVLDDVYASARPYTGKNAPVRLPRKAGGSHETRYLNFVYQPIFSATGDVTGIFVVGHDVTDRVTSEMELAERERQYRLLAAEQAAVLGQLGEGVIVIDPTGRVVFANDAAARIHGAARIELPLSQHSEAYGILTRDGAPCPAPDLPLARALIRDERVVNETWKIRRPDGAVAIAVGSASRVHAPDGHMIGAVLTFHDETRRESAIAALRESDLRQNLALAAGRMGVWDWDVTNDRLLWNERQCEIYGVDPMQFSGHNDDFIKRVHPECRNQLRSMALAAYADDALFESEFRIVRPSGEVRWVSTRSIALRDDKGRLVRAVGVNHDVTERRRAEEAQSLLIHELNHRVKNTLATVQSLAIQSFRNTSDPAAAHEAFMSRLLALSRAHNVLTRTNWTGAMLREVVAQATQPFRTGDGRRFDIEGPDAQLTSKEALVLSMCLHELATNAMKYGSLGREAGAVRLRWTVGEGGRNLHLTWTEAGGPKVSEPASRGFGSRLIEWGLAQELGGTASLNFAPQGLVCTIEAPLQSAHAVT
jgi:PAS domain S-box-containing protein